MKKKKKYIYIYIYIYSYTTQIKFRIFDISLLDKNIYIGVK